MDIIRDRRAALRSHQGTEGRRGLSTVRTLIFLFLAAFGTLATASITEPFRAYGALPSGFQDDLVTSVTGTPMDIAWTPDGRMLTLMRDGRLLIYVNDGFLSSPAIDLSQSVCTSGDEGAGGVAVHPNFTLNHYVYLYYTFKKSGTCNTGSTTAPVNRLSRFVLSGNNSINPASQTTLLDTPPLPTYDHMGDDLQFGHDGYLYLEIGDGGSPCCPSTFNNTENPGVLLGKSVRLTDSGEIPPGNPFTGSDSARCNLNGVPPIGSALGTKCQEILAMGLRNPFKAAFDPNFAATRFYTNDVGNVTWEEVDLGAAGVDYGWPTREGPCSAANPLTDCGPTPPGLTNPIFWYGHNVTLGGVNCGAITAAAFVPNGLWSGFQNAYLYGDWLCGGIWKLTQNSNGGFTSTLFGTVSPTGIISMRFGPYNSTVALYYLYGNYGSSGQVRRIFQKGSATVGGSVVPIDRLNMLVPYVGLASVIAAVALLTHSIKRVIRRRNRHPHSVHLNPHTQQRGRPSTSKR